jgi:hypothetical protein
VDDALENLMELEYLRGSFRAAAGLADELWAAASRRNDPRFQAESLVGKAYSASQLGDASEAVRCLAALAAMAADTTELTDELKIKRSGLAALIALGRGERQAALVAADDALLLTGVRPTYFGTFLGFVGPAEVYIARWEAGETGGDGRGRALVALARLKRYASVFPIGRPRAALLDGRRRWLTNDHAGAFRSWAEALDHATKLSMRFEQGLAHLEIGRHLPVEDTKRAEHLGAATEIFTALDAMPALRAVKDASGTPGAGGAPRPGGRAPLL